MKYIEIARNNVKNRGIVIPKESLQKEIEKAIEKEEELYYTVWTFDEGLKEHFKLYQTIRSYRGKASLEWLIFDIDKGDDTDKAVLDRTKAFVRRLTQDWDIRPEEMRIWYSGTGYHIYVPDYFHFEESESIRQEVKNTLKEYFPEVDLSIYGATGLIRAPYSLNTKTNRYKIPLTPYELFNLEADVIMRLAESSEEREVDEIEEADRNFSSYIVKATVEREAVQYRDEPTRVTTCMQHLYNKGANNGSRHNEAMRLTSAYRRQGVAKNAIVHLLVDWAPTLEKYEIQKIVDNIFDKGYQYSCNDYVMAKYCDPKCIFYTHKNYTQEVLQPEDIEIRLMDNAINMPYKKYIDLDVIFKLDSPYRIYEGEMVVFFGDTKIGKSTLAQNIMVSTPHIRWLLMPFENGVDLDGRRLLQIAHGLDKHTVMERLSEGKGLIQKINHIKMMEDTIGLKEVQKLINNAEVDAVMIDTADQLKVYDNNGREIMDYTAKTDAIALGLRDIARVTKKSIMIVHHISKHKAEDEDGRRKSMTIHALKGASAIEQKADKVISIEGERDDEQRIITSRGARDEAPFKKIVRFNKETFRLEV